MIEESNQKEDAVMAELVAMEEETDQNSTHIKNIEMLILQILQELKEAKQNNPGANPSGPTAPEWSERGQA